MAQNVIGYFCGSDSWGGLEMNQLRNAVWMKERGHNVVLFTRENTKITEEANKKGLTVQFIKKHRKYYDFNKALALKKALKSNQVSHLVVRDPKDMSICALAKSLMGGNLFLAYFMEMQIGIPKQDIIHTLRYKKYDLWSCPLPWLAKQVNQMTRFPKNRIKVIPSGLDLSHFENLKNKNEARDILDLNKNKTWIGLVGRFDEQKGQHLLLAAFDKIKGDFPDANVVFLGEKTKYEADDYYDELINFINDKQLDNRVEIRSFRPDVETFYAAIDIFVMATKAETFGMVTIEAMAAGLKIVGSNAGGTPEILNHGTYGALFESGDSKNLSKKLIELLDKKDFDAEKIREASKKYDAKNVCSQVEKALFI
jgi:glycosyltransferase involved in cell wall biosynthesis